MANAASWPSRICGEWQPVQSFAVAAANMPIVSMNSSIGMPLRTRMSLRPVSAIGGVSAGAVWRAAGAVWRATTAMLVTQKSIAASRSACLLRLFTAAVAVVVPEIHLRAVRQCPRHYVATIGPVARRRDLRRLCLADREHAGGGDAVCLVGAGAGTLEHPGLDLARLFVLDVQVPPHVRVRPLDPRQDAGDG